MDNVRLFLLFSGKRKSGKDYLTVKLQQRLGNNSQIIQISKPIKSEWAKLFNLNLNELLSDTPYKEIYRKDMINWSETIRAKDYGFFCKIAVQTAQKEIVIISDVRRKTDIQFFIDTFGVDKVKTIRITCNENVRNERGWCFIEGIDDVQSECDLDDYNKWDLAIDNSNKQDDEFLINTIISRLIS